jgi:hypothetical protein
VPAQRGRLQELLPITGAASDHIKYIFKNTKSIFDEPKHKHVQSSAMMLMENPSNFQI